MGYPLRSDDRDIVRTLDHHPASIQAGITDLMALVTNQMVDTYFSRDLFYIINNRQVITHLPVVYKLVLIYW
jgi:hypothetical protein